jgi:hypothetical protein
MQIDHQLSVLEKHRIAEFVICNNFNRIELATSDWYVMRLPLSVAHEFAVLAGDVARPKHRE